MNKLLDFIAGLIKIFSAFFTCSLIMGLIMILITAICAIMQIDSDIGIFITTAIILIPLSIWAWCRDL